MTDTRQKPKPSVSIIGAGRLGTTLATELANRDYPIALLVARTRKSVRRAAAYLDAPTRFLVAAELSEVKPTDLVFVTTPDDQIGDVVKRLAKTKRAQQRVVVLHTSGALSSRVLSPLLDLGWETGSFHPLVAVSDPKTATLVDAYWSVEGTPIAVRQAKKIVRELNGHTIAINPDDKALYHAAAVMASGNVVALFDVAIDMLTMCGVSRTDAQRSLAPLLKSAVSNLETKVPAKALTGSFTRGDLATIQHHLEKLSGEKLVLARVLYQLLGQRSLELAISNGLDGQVAKRIKTALKS